MNATHDEEWRTIPDWEGFYEASSLGRIRSVTREVPNRWGTLTPRTGKLVQPFPSSTGYDRVALYRDGQQTRRSVHSLVLLAFVGPYPPGLEIRHLNDVKTDNRLCNLQYGTRSDNNYDRVRNSGLKTHCVHGHEYTPENTIMSRRGNGQPNRLCRTCNRAYEVRRRERKSA